MVFLHQLVEIPHQLHEVLLVEIIARSIRIKNSQCSWGDQPEPMELDLVVL
jgi:hypothetical protein